jgi:hypothetical protein
VEAQKVNAVLTVKAVGCHDPASAAVTATAIELVNGERRSIPLKIDALSEPGTFAVGQQWPHEGRWVIQLAGRSDGAVTTTLDKAGPAGVDFGWICAGTRYTSKTPVGGAAGSGAGRA